MGFRLNHKKFGPFRVNFSSPSAMRKGKPLVSSVSLDTGVVNFRLWSANGQRGISSIDTPGQGSYRPALSTRAQRERTRG